MRESNNLDHNKLTEGETKSGEDLPGQGIQMQVGKTCPRCYADKLIYNGLLQLTCPNCGLVEAGVNT